jgi:hypothetical protein
MTKIEYLSIGQKLNSILDRLTIIKEDVQEAGGFITQDIEDEFSENIESAYNAIQDCLEKLESDEEYQSLKNISRNDELEAN